MIHDSALITGEVWVYRNNDLVAHTSNLVVDAGKEYIAGILGNQGTYAGDYIAIGSDGTAESVSDTSLGNEVGSRTQGALSVSGATFTLDTTIPTNNPATSQQLRETAIFTASSGGTMIARTTFGIITKEPADTLRIVWQITVG